MKLFTFPAFLFLTVLICNSQNLIGYNAGEIRKYMSANRNDMSINAVNNKTFSYLKYSDKYDTQTMLFFLDSDSVCRNVRIICNKSIKSAKVRELDSSYSRTGDSSWADIRSGAKYTVRLAENEWSFSINIDPTK